MARSQGINQKYDYDFVKKCLEMCEKTEGSYHLVGKKFKVASSNVERWYLNWKFHGDGWLDKFKASEEKIIPQNSLNNIVSTMKSFNDRLSKLESELGGIQ